MLGRKDESEVILTRSLLTALRELNPGRQEEGYHQAVEALIAYDAAKTALQTNDELYALQHENDLRLSLR